MNGVFAAVHAIFSEVGMPMFVEFLAKPLSILAGLLIAFAAFKLTTHLCREGLFMDMVLVLGLHTVGARCLARSMFSLLVAPVIGR
jgi:hypothetical protein